MTIVRGVEGRFAKLDVSIADVGYRSKRRRIRPVYPMMIEDMTHLISEEGDDPIGLLVFGSMVRDELPWMYELIVDVYRDVRGGDSKATQHAVDRLRRMTRMLSRGLHGGTRQQQGGSHRDDGAASRARSPPATTRISRIQVGRRRRF